MSTQFKTNIRRLSALLFSILICVSAIPMHASAAVTVYSQNDKKWGSHSYGYQNAACTDPATIGTSGCGILALTNAVYYMNSNFISPIPLADYALNNGYRVHGKGTSYDLYPAYAKSYGGTYGFSCPSAGFVKSLATLKDHLLNGNTAIASSTTVHSNSNTGHIMAVVAYDAATNKYLILDSCVSSNRFGTSSSWQTINSSDLTTGNGNVRFGGFVFLYNTATPKEPGYYKVTANSGLHFRTGIGTEYQSLAVLPKGTIIFISDYSSGWGKTNYNGYAGWVCMDYVTKVSGEEQSVTSSTSVSEDGYDFIKNEEGFSAKQYWDVSHYSIGYGTSCRNGEYPNGITREQADNLLRNAMENSYVPSLRAFLSTNNIAVSQSQFDALASFTYNLGAGTWSKNWKICTMLKKGSEQYSEGEIRQLFGLYVYADGKVQPGLVARRAREAELFIRGMHETSPVVKQAPWIISPVSESGGLPAGEAQTLSWEPVSGASHYTVAVKRLFGDPDTEESNENEEGTYIIGGLGDSRYTTTKTSVSIPAALITSGSWYKYAVGAEFSDGTSKWSWIYMYAYEAQLQHPIITSPANNSEISIDQDLHVSFNSVNGADHYRVCIKSLEGQPEVGNDSENGFMLVDTTMKSNDIITVNREYLHDGQWIKIAVGAYSTYTGSSWTSHYALVKAPSVPEEPEDPEPANHETAYIQLSQTTLHVTLDGDPLPEYRITASTCPAGADVSWMTTDSSVCRIIKSNNQYCTLDFPGGVGTCKLRATIADETGHLISSTCTITVESVVPGSGSVTTYTLAYDLNGGATAIPIPPSGFDSNADPNSYTITSIIPYRTGYTFLGWSESRTATQPTYKVGQRIQLTSNTTLFAVWQQDDVTDLPEVIDETTPILSLSKTTASPSDRVDVTLSVINHNPGIVALSVDLSFNEQILRLVDVKNGDLFGESAFMAGKDLTSPYTVIFEDGAARQNNTELGILATFTFEVRTDASLGEETPITLHYTKNSTFDKDLNEVEFALASGSVIVTNRAPGDVNNDGTVDLKDVVLIRRFLSGGWNVTVNETIADVNRDGVVDLKDVVLIRRFLTGGWGVTLQ